MENFFTTTLGVVISLGAILTVAVTGLLYVIGIYKKGKDGDDDRLINILQTTVTELEKKVNKQTVDIERLTKEVDDLRRENGKYIEIFQGRDGETKEFYKRMYHTMDVITQTHDLITTMATSIDNTNRTMAQLIDLLAKSVDVVGKVAGTNKQLG